MAHGMTRQPDERKQKMATIKPVLVQWILDTRTWWPEVTETRQLETHAARALALLPAAERTSALKYYHVRDARMAIASSLLKHFVIAKLAPSVPWHATTVTRDARTKPIYLDPSTGLSPVAFNITHQAGIVALIGAAQGPSLPPIELGIDIVSPAERRARDHDLIQSEGWARFVDMHADVFAPQEASYLKYQVLSAVPGLVPSGAAPEAVVDAKLRAFYALWALREAYVKMTGEALLAEWLRDLEFRRFRPPAPTPAWEVPAREEGGAGEGAGEDGGRGPVYGAQVVRNTEIRFRGKRVEDVNLCLRAVGPDYMICTAVRTPGDPAVGLAWRLGPYEALSLEEVLAFAESSI
ncbi:hypothetical protein B0H67DRAFT_560642 [Lasiosphaeris hirsuta]|uniref:holo-[acyl-carrier-protein] synthase n=1 Tax=Lasiosphaeris hirsuta TaxID=260670 RepID=A0AA40B9P9_9PEZI|nr:hypothetical protein B0H67DRAFT_560642 [Lasiosphaeris hirsuta]